MKLMAVALLLTLVALVDAMRRDDDKNGPTIMGVFMSLSIALAVVVLLS